MNFLQKIFRKKEEPINSYAEFWAWFQNHERTFFNIVKNHKHIEKGFFDKLSPKLDALKDGYFFVTGMYDDQTVELILTADGTAKNIVFIEDLVEAAPALAGWRFTALKPALDLEDVRIEMGDLTFNGDNIHFYSNDLAGCPDEIDLVIVHDHCTEENKKQISNGTYIFLDNYLGELDFVNNIDNITTIGRTEAQKELIPIRKLKDYLSWRQKEFIEKYEAVRYDTENDTHSILEAELKNGNKLVALINTELLHWDGKASHPWVAALTIKYDGSKNNGMPDANDSQVLNSIGEEVLKELRDKNGFLNIGRQTTNGEREIYFACRDFRTPSRVFFKIQQNYSDRFEIAYDLYKDKYWQSFNRFNPPLP